MIEYSNITLENDEKYIIVDTINYNNVKYVLVSKILENNIISNEFNIYIYNDNLNSIKKIEEDEFYIIEELFENKLNKVMVNLKNSNFDLSKLNRLRIIGINNYDYILEDLLGNTINKNIELYIDKKLKIGDYIYLSDNIIKEKNIFQYGKIFDKNIDEDELLVIEYDNNNYIYLQRYYG